MTATRIYNGSLDNLDDVAVLRAARIETAVPVRFARRSDARMHVAALGIPPNDDEDRGVVASAGELIELLNSGATLIHGASSVRGFSGGPVISRDAGELVAIVHGTGADAAHFEGIGVARVVAALRAAGVPPLAGAEDAARVVTAQRAALETWLTTLYRDQDAHDPRVERRAQGGDGAAAASLANAFAFGRGVPASATKAASWDLKAAAAGDPRGIYQLGTDYAEGRGVVRQPLLAYQTFVRAARLKYPPAMIAAATVTGEGVDAQRDAKAVANWLAAANASQAWQAPYLLLGVDPAARIPFDESPCSRDAPTDALSAYERGVGFVYGFGRRYDPACGLALILASARAGVPYAALFLGRAYERGALVERDANEAFRWYVRAADSGSDEGAVSAAAVAIATAGTGTGYVQRSFSYLLRAKSDGDPRGLDLFGRALLAGFGTARDPGGAFNVFKAASDAGLVAAHGDLATCYERGCGKDVAPNLAAAENELQKAAAGGDAAAIARLAAGYASGHFGASKDGAHALATYDTFAAGDGDAARVLHARGLLAYGVGGDATNARAVALLEGPALRGYPAAQFVLGSLYDAGTAVKKNDFEAATWYFRAAARGDDDAAFAIAKFYRDGRAVQQSSQDALRFLSRGAYSNPAAMNALAESETASNRAVARTILLTRAARRGFRMAQFHLGEAYANGVGVAKDPVCAALWFVRSARPRPDGEPDDADVYWASHYSDAATRANRAAGALAALAADAARTVRAQADGDVLEDWFGDCTRRFSA